MIDTGSPIDTGAVAGGIGAAIIVVAILLVVGIILVVMFMRLLGLIVVACMSVVFTKTLLCMSRKTTVTVTIIAGK